MATPAPLQHPPLTAAHFGLYLRLALYLSALFVLTYGATNWINDQRPAVSLHRWFMHSELHIPFVPGMIFVYHSIQLLLFGVPLLLLDDDHLKRLAKAITLAIVVSGILFLIFPTQLGFSRPAQVAGYPWIYTQLYAVDLPHNLVPSLHVSLSSLTVLAGARGQPRGLGLILWAWWGALCVSVLLVHQHHLLDIAGGLVLGVVCYRWVYCSSTPLPQHTPAATGAGVVTGHKTRARDK